jgi:hypothetical protein
MTKGTASSAIPDAHPEPSGPANRQPILPPPLDQLHLIPLQRVDEGDHPVATGKGTEKESGKRIRDGRCLLVFGGYSAMTMRRKKGSAWL